MYGRLRAIVSCSSYCEDKNPNLDLFLVAGTVAGFRAVSKSDIRLRCTIHWITWNSTSHPFLFQLNFALFGHHFSNLPRIIDEGLVREMLTRSVWLIVPRFRESVRTLNLIRPSVPLSVCLSVCHKNFNIGHNFCTITDRALILGMCVPCDKTFPVVPCRDLDGDLWPSSRSNLLPSGGPQFSEFAC